MYTDSALPLGRTGVRRPLEPEAERERGAGRDLVAVLLTAGCFASPDAFPFRLLRCNFARQPRAVVIDVPRGPRAGPAAPEPIHGRLRPRAGRGSAAGPRQDAAAAGP